jgi:hypothetical protein
MDGMVVAKGRFLLALCAFLWIRKISFVLEAGFLCVLRYSRLRSSFLEESTTWSYGLALYLMTLRLVPLERLLWAHITKRCVHLWLQLAYVFSLLPYRPPVIIKLSPLEKGTALLARHIACVAHPEVFSIILLFALHNS